MPHNEFDPPNTGIAWLDLALLIIAVLVITGSVLTPLIYKFIFKPLISMIRELKTSLAKTDEKVDLAKMHAASAACDAAIAKEEVKNTHTTNLRHDLDGIVATLESIASSQARFEETQNQHTRDIGGLREENRLTRQEIGVVNSRVSDVHTAQIEHERLKAGMEPRLAALEKERNDKIPPQ